MDRSGRKSAFTLVKIVGEVCTQNTCRVLLISAHKLRRSLHMSDYLTGECLLRMRAVVYRTSSYFNF
jgi:hypothetical protein